ncbi:MAG TPA: STAS domain-containing protein [Acidimicrobiales bacterium]
MDEGTRSGTYEVGFDVGPSYVLVRLEGEIDLGVYKEVADELAGAALMGRPLLVVDLDGVTFLSIAGARLLLTADSHMTARGGQLAIVCKHLRLQRLLQMAHLDRRLQVFPSLRVALGQVLPPTPSALSMANRHWQDPTQRSA